MLNTFIAILPIFLLIVIGYVTKNYFFQEESFWKTVEKLVYYVFFPALLILDISHANFDSSTISTAIMATAGGTLLVAVLIFFGQLFFKAKNDLFTSIFQVGVRYNSYVFLALAQSLFGAEGIALSGVFVAYMIILTNVISVLVMNHYGNGNKKSLKGTLIALVQNPLIIAALLGLLINRLGLSLPDTLGHLFGYLGNAATALSLMSVGAGLMLTMKFSRAIAITYTVLLKLLVIPLFTLMLLKLLAVSGVAANIALLYAAVPCAGNAYILSRQMGGDSQAMASIITWTTLLSSISITLILGNILF